MVAAVELGIGFIAAEVGSWATSPRLPGYLVTVSSGGFLEGSVGRIVKCSSPASVSATVGPSLLGG